LQWAEFRTNPGSFFSRKRRDGSEFQTRRRSGNEKRETARTQQIQSRTRAAGDCQSLNNGDERRQSLVFQFKAIVVIPVKVKKQIIVIFCWTLFLFICSTGFTYACTCRPNETVDKEFKNTPNVVVLTLQNVELLDKESEGGGNIRHSTFVVEKAFKGNLKPNDKLTFINQYSSCGWSFSKEFVGTKYLFYLGEKPDKENIWSVPPCSRSGSTKDTADDLFFFGKDRKGKKQNPPFRLCQTID
jgi:hypothetical protein